MLAALDNVIRKWKTRNHSEAELSTVVVNGFKPRLEESQSTYFEPA